MNKSDKAYKNYSWFVFIATFLVIAAGGIVRMTQSGMGCPDWPTCFGMWIPPTDASQLPADFEKYLSKQDIDHSFNVYHTWIEYINRLLGALLGLFILGHVVWSFKKFWSRDRRIVLYSFLMLIAVGFEGWLGKIVVDSNLSIVKITLHMLGALVIAMLPLMIIVRLSKNYIDVSRKLKWLVLLFLCTALIQIILGTQVREEIDIISKALSYESRELWISRLSNIFVIHRSFSWLIVILAGFLFYQYKHIIEFKRVITYLLVLIAFIVLLGIIMAYFGMPALAQPLHLIFGCLLFVMIFYIFIRLKVER